MKTYTQSDVERALTDAGLCRGDTVFVTTSLGMLGVASGVETPDELNALHLNALKNVVCEQGTILVPTYSYTFGASSASEYAIFDPEVTPSRIGPFPEFFRKQPRVIRSIDPMMSVAGFGPRAAELFSNLPSTSYGKGCLFSRLISSEIKCCSVGLGPNWMPFIHHLDWLTGAEFRYDKLFRGILHTNGRSTETPWVYSVAVLCPEADPNGHVIGNMATEAGIWKFAPVGRARVYICSCREYFEYAHEAAKKNPWVTAVGPKSDVLALERARVPPAVITKECKTIQTITDLIQVVASFAKDEVSDGADFAFETLSEYIPIKLSRYKSGENHFDWIIPERWNLGQASVKDESGSEIWSLADGRGRVYSYSQSVEKSIDTQTLLTHATIVDEVGIQLVNCSNNRDWGFCITQQEAASLKGKCYDVCIKSAFSCGQLTIGEYFITGASSVEVVVVSYLTGEGYNFDLLGAIASAEAARKLQKVSSMKYSVRFVWVTGTAGFAAWFNSSNLDSSSVALCIELDGSQHKANPITYYGASEIVHSIRAGFEKSAHASSAPVLPAEFRMLRAGENPCALQKLPGDKLNVLSLSIGNYLSASEVRKSLESRIDLVATLSALLVQTLGGVADLDQFRMN